MSQKLDFLVKFTYDNEYKGWVADVLNLYGCMSQGKTKEEALINVKKAIDAYLEATKKEINQKSELKITSTIFRFA